MVTDATIQATCPKCQHVATPRGKALTVALSCPACGVYYCVHDKTHDQFTTKHVPRLGIGTRGTIKGITYEVMGFTAKRETKYRYIWYEYLLFNPHHGIAFLSEYEGNWNFLKPYAKHPYLTGAIGAPEIAEGKFQLYAKYRAQLLYATGEFFTDVIEATESSYFYEHICPPYLLTYEDNNKQLAAYLGEYIAPKNVAEAFKIKVENLPPKKGMGYTQPHPVSVDETTLVLSSILSILAVFLLQLFLNNSAMNKKVTEHTFYQKDLTNQKMFTTESFELKGDEKNVVVNISAPISNDWFFAEYSLINEVTDQEFVFTNEFEYYTGVDDGERWTEGGSSGEAFLSRIPGGRYHINIYPEFSTTNHEFKIMVFRDAPFYSNLIVLLVLFCLFPAGFYAYKYYVESARWSESDYSPYN